MARLRRVDRSIEIKFLADMKEVVAASKATQKTLGGMSGTAMRFNNIAGMVTQLAQFAEMGVDTFFDLARSASDYDQAVGKSRAVFGAYSEEVEAFAKTAAETWGQSRTAAVDYAGTIGNMLTAQGIATEQAKDMSLEMVKLAADISAFSNIDIGEALTALRAGLSGETEPLRRFGINVLDAEVKARALADGIWDGTGAMTAQQKLMGRYNLILRQTMNMVGSFAREQDTLQTNTQILNAEIENLKITLGEGFAGESAVNIVRGLRTITGAFNDLAESIKGAGGEEDPMRKFQPGGGESIYDWGNLFFLLGPLGVIGKLGEQSAEAAPEVEGLADSQAELAAQAKAAALSEEQFNRAVQTQIDWLNDLKKATDAETQARRDRLAVLEEETNALTGAFGKLDDPTLRQTLRQFGEKGYQALQKAFKSKDPERRQRAQEAAIEYGKALVAAGKQFQPSKNPVINKWIQKGIEEANYQKSLDRLLRNMEAYLNANPMRLNPGEIIQILGGGGGGGKGGSSTGSTQSAPTVNVYAGVGDPVQIGRQVSKVLSAYSVRGGAATFGAGASTFGVQSLPAPELR